MEESQAQLAVTLEGAQYIFIYEAPNEVLKQRINSAASIAMPYNWKGPPCIIRTTYVQGSF